MMMMLTLAIQAQTHNLLDGSWWRRRRRRRRRSRRRKKERTGNALQEVASPRLQLFPGFLAGTT